MMANPHGFVVLDPEIDPGDGPVELSLELSEPPVRHVHVVRDRLGGASPVGAGSDGMAISRCE